MSVLMRYGIATLAATLAALFGTEARGGWWSHSCSTCNSCCDAPAYGPGSVRSVRMGLLRLGPPRPMFRRRPVLPPPGTLGRTYHQISRPIPETEHPRTGMLEICGVPAHLHVTVNGMNGYRGANGIWYFKTDRPLIPCVPYIKTVRVHPPHVDPQRCADFRVLRLIPESDRLSALLRRRQFLDGVDQAFPDRVSREMDAVADIELARQAVLVRLHGTFPTAQDGPRSASWSDRLQAGTAPAIAAVAVPTTRACRPLGTSRAQCRNRPWTGWSARTQIGPFRDEADRVEPFLEAV